MRETSIESYQKLVDDGILSERIGETFAYIALSQTPVIARDIPKCGWKLCAKLRRMGLIREVGTGHDSRTNRRVLLWEATGFIPTEKTKTPVVKRPTRKQLEEELLSLKMKIFEMESRGVRL